MKLPWTGDIHVGAARFRVVLENTCCVLRVACCVLRVACCVMAVSDD